MNSEHTSREPTNGIERTNFLLEEILKELRKPTEENSDG